VYLNCVTALVGGAPADLVNLLFVKVLKKVVEAEGKEEEGERKAAHSLLDIVLCLCPTLTADNLALV
jgi:hypothetical protein